MPMSPQEESGLGALPESGLNFLSSLRSQARRIVIEMDLRGGKVERETGLEPATLSLEG